MVELSEKKLKALEGTAEQVRELIIQTLLRAGSGHAAGPLGMADIFTAHHCLIILPCSRRETKHSFLFSFF
jgi:transketolase